MNCVTFNLKHLYKKKGKHMKKNYFFGKYYKFISKEGFSFAFIDSYSDEGKAKQVITKEGSFVLKDLDAIKINDHVISFNINEDNLKIFGVITMGQFSPLKSNAMGPFRLFSMQCAHDVYSMHHMLKGMIVVNGKNYDFNDGYGYIEGDKGTSFPEKYIWYNSVGKDYSLMLAIATIPFGLINFTGLLCFIHFEGKEYRMSTYNGAKIISYDKKMVKIKKGKYQLEIHLNDKEGFELKAPDKGKMSRLIKENIAVETSFKLMKKNEVILERKDKYSSMEYMY